jgi:uncharacterized protein with PQ loop repeat
MEALKLMLDSIGWVATAIFSCAYFCRNAAALRKIQAAAACLWIAYGLCINARPVVIANLVVAAAALYSVLRPRREEELQPPG